MFETHALFDSRIRDGYELELYSRHLEETLTKEEKEFICSIISYFGKYTAAQLSNWSRMPNSPWQNAVVTEGAGLDIIVKDEDISDYFLKNVFETN